MSLSDPAGRGVFVVMKSTRTSPAGDAVIHLSQPGVTRLWPRLIRVTDASRCTNAASMSSSRMRLCGGTVDSAWVLVGEAALRAKFSTQMS